MRLEDLNLRDPIKIGYYDPFDVLPSIGGELAAHLPLSNLHWRYDPLKPVKSIPLLPVELKEEFPSLHRKTSSESYKPLDNVYSRLMFVDSPDIDKYRSQVRPLINEWLKTLVKPHHVLWGIILISSTGKKDKKSTLIKTSIFEKLRTDFGLDGKHILPLEMPHTRTDENIFRIYENYTDNVCKLEAYNNLMAKLKFQVLETFNRRFVESSKLIERLTAIPDLNAVQAIELFREKLRLASVFKDMRCLEESLGLYEELYEGLKKLDSGTGNAQILSLLKCNNLKNFDPEYESSDTDPYELFCQAVAEREPLDILGIKLGLFLKMSLLLQTLANFAKSISLASVFVSKLLQNTISFLNDCCEVFTESVDVDQWVYTTADFYLKLPIAQKLINLDNEEREESVNVTGILEYSAELELFKRLILNKLAVRKGLESPTAGVFLKEVSFDKDESASIDLDLSVHELSRSLETQHHYEDLYKQLTISAMKYFADCGRIKSIDILGIDLAMLHHKRGEYQDALKILRDSYDYFILNGWNYVGGVLLDVLLDCVKHVVPDVSDQFFVTTLRLFTSMHNGKVVLRGINDYSILKTRNDCSKFLDELCFMAKNLTEPQNFELTEFFAIEVLPYINIDEDGRYYVKAKMRNFFGIQVNLQHVKVTMADLNTSDETISFLAHDICINEDGLNMVNLYTNKFVLDFFKIVAITIEMAEKFSFSTIVDHLPSEFGDDTVIHHAEVEESRNLSPSRSPMSDILHMYPVPGHFRIDIASPKKVRLGSCGLECIVHIGPRKVDNILLTISTSSNGLRIFKELDLFSIKTAEPNEEVTFAFDCSTESKHVDVQVDCQYEIEGEKYEYKFRVSHDLNLKVSVSVQDIFRSTSIYSKFQIGCVDCSSPVQVINCDYTCPENRYRITSLNTISKEKMSFVVYANQPINLFYKLEPAADHFDPSDVLDFTIRYSNLQEECIERIQKKLWLELVERKSQKYFHLLAPFTSEIKFDYPNFDIDKRVRCLEISQCSELVNETILRHVQPQAQSALLGIIDELFTDKTLKDSQNYDTVVNCYELYIPVSMPSLDVLHYTEFLLEKKLHLVVGGLLEAELVINSSTKWSTPLAKNILASSSPKLATSEPNKWFELTIHSEEDWLITGLKKQKFHVNGFETTTKIKLSLIPLNAGELVIPKFTIKAIHEDLCTMDVVQENAFETVVVSPEFESVSFAF